MEISFFLPARPIELAIHQPDDRLRLVFQIEDITGHSPHDRRLI